MATKTKNKVQSNAELTDKTITWVCPEPAPTRFEVEELRYRVLALEDGLKALKALQSKPWECPDWLMDVAKGLFALVFFCVCIGLLSGWMFLLAQFLCTNRYWLAGLIAAPVVGWTARLIGEQF